jgi:hypothetical protein
VITGYAPAEATLKIFGIFASTEHDDKSPAELVSLPEFRELAELSELTLRDISHRGSPLQDLLVKKGRLSFPEPTRGPPELHLDRSHPFLGQVMKQLPTSFFWDLCRPMSPPWVVEYKQERGVDAGGLGRDFVSELASEVMNPSSGIFRATPNGRNSRGSEQDRLLPVSGMDAKLRYVGALVAIAIVSNLQQPFKFSRIVWDFICRGEVGDVTVADVFLSDLIETVRSCKNEEELQNQHLVFVGPDWSGTERELIAGGADREVDNGDEFIRAFLKFRRVELEGGLRAMRDGFRSVLPLEEIEMFTAEELEKTACGETDVTFDRLKQLIVMERCRVSEWGERLIEALSRLDAGGRSQFLRFVTGVPGLPPVGFPQPRIKVSLMEGTRLPVAHTCFFAIDVWVCSSTDELAKLVKTAITEVGSFEIA